MEKQEDLIAQRNGVFKSWKRCSRDWIIMDLSVERLEVIGQNPSS
jgi:hypothetical protein